MYKPQFLKQNFEASKLKKVKLGQAPGMVS